MEKNLVIGVDVGGTKVAAGLVNEQGEIRSHLRVPMIANGSADDGLGAVLSAISQLLRDGTPVRGIGVCSPGPLDPAAGVILNPPNLPCWRHFPLTDALRKVYPVPEELDKKIARLKLDSKGIKIDRLTAEQEEYLASWSEGT